MAQLNNEKHKIFKEHVADSAVLVVDTNTSSRTRLLKILYDLGCARHMIHTASSVTEAEAIMDNNKIGVILSEYFINGGSGFDLFKSLRLKRPSNLKLVMILVTSNMSQTAVARAAEEEVDSFIIKPYTVQSIQENLITTVAAKVAPSEYLLTIETGKALLFEGKYEEATSIFKKASQLHPKPSLAMAYLGQTEYIRELVDNAKGSYFDGLKFNSIHFKCLIGLYDMFIQQENWEEAYQIVKKIAKFFPANPSRMAEVIKLAVRTGNFEDIQTYYEIFTGLEERTDFMIKHVGAGLYVAGKHFLMNDRREEALKFFDQAVVSCSTHTTFLKAIIATLVKYEMINEAEKYLLRFDPALRKESDFLVSDFIVMSGNGTAPTDLVKHGLKIYNQNIRDPEFLRAMIKAIKLSGYRNDMIAKLHEELEAA